jgi:Fic-DOC domain mobile mystery protein B
VFGETPVGPDEKAAFVPGVSASTLSEIDSFEHIGLAGAYASLLRRIDREGGDCLWDDHEFRAFHREAFGHVWTWAGKYRTLETNLGIDPSQIAVSVRSLLDDAREWRETNAYDPVGQVVRFHIGVGRIHPFVNGNGRLSRLYAEAMLYAVEPEAELGWSEQAIPDASSRRRRYIEAIRRAEATRDYTSIIEFACTQ